MTKKEMLILVGTLLGFWVVGAILFLPWTQSQLRKAATAELATEGPERFENVDVAFGGQVATLKGKVLTDADRDDAARIVDDMRVPVFFGRAKPKAVTAVRNQLELGSDGPAKPKVETGSSPFVTAARYGETIRIDGKLGSTAQKRTFTDAIASRYPGTRILDMTKVDSGVGSGSNPAGLANLPPVVSQEWFAAGNLNGSWSSFPGASSDEAIEEGLRNSFSDMTASLGGLSALRSWQESRPVDPVPPTEPRPPEPPPASASNVVQVLPDAPSPAPDPDPEPTPPEDRIIGRLTFKPNAARADDQQLAYALRLVRNVLRRLPDSQFLLLGHCDSKGDEYANLRVSQSRAQIVADYLIANGVEADILSAEGRGEAEPIGDNDTAEGRQQNRRVEILVRKNTTTP